MNNINWDELIQILKKSAPEKILLFGSRAGNSGGYDSDIDLFIIMKIPSDKLKDERLEIRKSLRNFMFKSNTPIDVFVDNPENIDHRLNIGDQFYEEVMQNGKVLYSK